MLMLAVLPDGGRKLAPPRGTVKLEQLGATPDAHADTGPSVRSLTAFRDHGPHP